MIVGLFSELIAPGGVQTAGRQTAAALVLAAGRRNMDCRFLSLNDPVGTHSLSVGGVEIVFEGFGGSRARFIGAAIRASRDGAQVAWALHPNLAPIVAAMKILRPRLQTIVCAHGVEVWTCLPTMRQLALRRADAVVAPSRYTGGKLATEQGISNSRIHRLPWALDPSFEALAAAPRRDSISLQLPARRVILTVARWSASERYKGLDELIEVMPRIRAAIPDAVLVAIGNGDDRSRLEQKAATVAGEGAVTFLNSLQGADLVAWYARCDVFALPSSGEGFGLVFLEAMALGKPVVGGDHGGIPDIVEDGVAGFLVRQENCDQLASVLIELLRDEKLRHEMGQRGRECLLRNFRFENFSARVEEILRQICSLF